MFCTPVGIEMRSRLEQFWKALLAMVVIPAGRSTSFRLLHSSKVLCDSTVMLAGMAISSSDLQLLKTPVLILRMLFGNVTSTRLEHPANSSVGNSSTLFGISTAVRLEHPEKARVPIFSMPFGITIEVMPVDFSKAPDAISST